MRASSTSSRTTACSRCSRRKPASPSTSRRVYRGLYNFKASPIGANGKLYLASEEGDVIVVKMGETFEVLATNTIADETFVATPAIMNGEIYLRGRNTLYSIR